MKKFTDYALRQIKEQANLTEIDMFLIDHWFSTLPPDSEYNPDMKVIEFLEMQATRKAYAYLHKRAIDMIWTKGSLNLIKAIVNKTQFSVSYSNEMESLPREMLPERFSSFDKISSTDPRAEIAKKLGMTVVL